MRIDLELQSIFPCRSVASDCSNSVHLLRDSNRRRLCSTMNRLLWLFMFVSLAASAAPPQPVIVRDDAAPMSIGGRTEILEDETGALAFADVRTGAAAARFVPSNTDVPNCGVTRSAIWCRIVLTGSAAGDRFLYLDNATLDSVTVWEASGDSELHIARTGTYATQNMREYPIGMYLFRLHLRPGVADTLYLRARGNATMQFPLSVGGASAFIPWFSRIDLFHGCYFGIILVVALYNLFIFFSIRDRVYLYYIGYALTIGLFHAYLNGHLYYVGDGWLQAWMGRHFMADTSLILTFIALFSARFLDLRDTAPGLLRGLWIFSAAALMPAVVELAGNLWESDVMAQIVALVMSAYLLFTAAYVYWRGYRAAKYYLVAWVAFLSGIIVFTLAVLGFLPFNEFTKKAAEIGSGIEMFLISLALADKINIFKTEKEVAQRGQIAVAQENERLIRDQNVILERRVEERTHELNEEKERSDTLLLNILPEVVASELKETGQSDARFYDNVTVLFTDFVEFTATSSRITPAELVAELNACFSAFDDIVGRCGVEKVKTVGDAYLAVAGLPVQSPEHALSVVRAAREIQSFMADRLQTHGSRTFRIRIGVHSGSVVAGIVGKKKFAYDIWGDTVNTAARMEQNCEPGEINISGATYELVKNHIACHPRGRVFAKGKGEVEMYYLAGSA